MLSSLDESDVDFTIPFVISFVQFEEKIIVLHFFLSLAISYTLLHVTKRDYVRYIKYFINYLKEVLFKLLLTLIITELENSDLPAVSVLKVSMPTQI